MANKSITTKTPVSPKPKKGSLEAVLKADDQAQKAGFTFYLSKAHEKRIAGFKRADQS